MDDYRRGTDTWLRPLFLGAGLIMKNARLLMKHHVEKRAVNLDMAIIVDQAHLAELVHEETDARTRGADHFGQCLLADLREDRFRLCLFAKVREQEKQPCQPLFD